MADKTIWICGGERGWAVRMDGRVLEAGLPIEAAMTRAKKLAAFIEEGDQSAELRIMQADGFARARALRLHPTTRPA
jgi:hypothetical protein